MSDASFDISKHSAVNGILCVNKKLFFGKKKKVTDTKKLLYKYSTGFTLAEVTIRKSFT